MARPSNMVRELDRRVEAAPMNPVEDLEPLLTSKEVLAMFKLTRQGLWKITAEGKFPPADIVISRSCKRWSLSLIRRFRSGKWKPEPVRRSAGTSSSKVKR